MEQDTYGLLGDAVCHRIEHIVSGHLVFNKGIALAVCLQSDTLTQLIHVIDVIHPLTVYCLKQYHTLKLTYLLGRRELGLLGLIKLNGLLL